MPIITLSVPQKRLDQWDAAAMDDDRSRSDFIRHIVNRVIDGRLVPATKPQAIEPEAKAEPTPSISLVEAIAKRNQGHGMDFLYPVVTAAVFLAPYLLIHWGII